MISAGQNLRVLRVQLGLTLRDVENASLRIAERHGSEEFGIAPSRLSDIETKGMVPSIYRLYSLAVIYRQDPREIFTLYGVNFNQVAADLELCTPTKSHISTVLKGVSALRMPLKLDPSFDLRRTTNLGRAAMGYVSRVSANAGILLRVGELATDSSDAHILAAGRELIDRASRLRLNAILVLMKLSVAFILPGVPLSVGGIADGYKDLSRLLVQLSQLRVCAGASRISASL